MNTPWKKSNSRFMRTRPCPRPWPKPRSIRSAGWWTCDRSDSGPGKGSARHRNRCPGHRRRVWRCVPDDRAPSGALAAADRDQSLRPERERARSNLGNRGGDTRRRDLQLAAQSRPREYVATRCHQHPVRVWNLLLGHSRRSGVALSPIWGHGPADRRQLRAGHRRKPLGDTRECGIVTDRVLEVVEAGVVPYGEALEWQRALAQARIEGRLANDVLLLLEHPAVVTLGRNSDAGHLLSRDGIEVFEIERGGDVTFHGPGQLVGYPIIDLTGHQRDLHWYLRTLEQALIDALAGLDISATRNPGYTGVWTGRSGDDVGRTGAGSREPGAVPLGAQCPRGDPRLRAGVPGVGAGWETSRRRARSMIKPALWSFVLPALLSAQLPSRADLLDSARGRLAQLDGTISVPGLDSVVEVRRDRWGVPHIYAKTQQDLFFAQGFVAAQDRLWQMEMWRRIGEGRLAEVVGPGAVERDRIARLMRYRGDMTSEWASYAPDAREIVRAFVDGVNAWIAHIRTHPPIEFTLLGSAPEPWSYEVPLQRMAALAMTGNALDELERARLVRLVIARAAIRWS